MRQAPLHMRFFAHSSPMSCLPCWWRKPTGTMTRLLLHQVAWTTFHHRSSYEWGECKRAFCIYPCFKRFHTLTVYKAKCTDAFHSLPQVPVGSGDQEARPAAKRGRRHQTSRPWNSTPYFVVAYIHRSLSTYLTMAVVIPKPNRQLPIYCTSFNKLIICRCQQTSSVAVNKLFNCRRSLNQSNSNKPSLLKTAITRPKMFQRKL